MSTISTDRTDPTGVLSAQLPPLDGRLLGPGDPGWDAARTAWQLSVDQRPAAVVEAGSADDVVATVRAAAAAGLRVAPQATGHNAAPLGPLADTVLLRTTALRGLHIDVAQRTARIEAGVLWGELTEAAAEVGLAGLAGTSRTIGVVGYTLGGGLSWFSRSLGLAANQVVAAEIVTADGRLRRIDADRDADLFWAIRGGGGNFGVVTALELRLFPITELVAGSLFWPIERAADVLHTWRALLPDLPEAVASLGRLLRLPPLPEIPEPLRGGSFVVIEVAALLDQESTDSYLRPLRDLGPTLDTVHPIPVTELGDLHMDPPAPTPVAADGIALTSVPAAALDALLALVGPASDSRLLTVDLRHTGGAIAPGRVEGGAVSGFGSEMFVFPGTITPDAAATAAAHAEIDAIRTALEPWTADTAYINFAETRRDPAALYEPDTLRRLRAVKAAYDPTDVIRGNHPVGPAKD